MSSPTISVPQGTSDTSLATIMDLFRSLVNDTQAGATATPGEGQIATNNPAISPFVQPLLNSSIRDLYRLLRLIGDPELIRDNVIVEGLTPINSPRYGLASPDAAVQVFLGFGGYFDGKTINSNIVLPGDVLFMERVWERKNGTNNLFQDMTQPQFGLPSVLQGQSFGMWEWRNNNINMVGATQTRDLRLRYYCSLPTFYSATLNFASTFVPILDCTESVAYGLAVKYCLMLGSPMLEEMRKDYAEQIRQLRLQHVRRAQSVEYHRIGYGNSNSNYGSFDGTFYWGWQ